MPNGTSLDVKTAVSLIKHFHLTADATLDLVNRTDSSRQRNYEASSSYMLGHMECALFNAIQSAGGMAAAW